MKHKALIRRLQISCLGLDHVDPLRLLVDDVVAALRENAMREVQEPVACQYAKDVAMFKYRCVGRCQYDTSPPEQRTWVGLTDVQIGQVLDDPYIAEAHQGHWRVLPFEFARAIEAKLKEKNT